MASRAQSFSVRCGFVIGAAPNQARSSGGTSAWWSTTPAGILNRRRRHACGSVRCMYAGSASDSPWRASAVWCEITPALSDQSQAMIFVLTCGEVDEPVDASALPHDPPGADVLEQQLCRVAGIGCLPGCEVALLCARCLVQEVPVRLLRCCEHAQIVTIGYVSCNTIPSGARYATLGLVSCARSGQSGWNWTGSDDSFTIGRPWRRDRGRQQSRSRRSAFALSPSKGFGGTILASSSNPHRSCCLALADSGAGFRLFASVFGFCQCNDTRSVTRGNALREGPPGRYTAATAETRYGAIADLRSKREGASGTLNLGRKSDEESIDESRHP
jgi:hypothetical protein